MPAILEYMSHRPRDRPSSRGTLARASIVVAVAACAAEAVAFALVFVFGLRTPAWLAVLCLVVLVSTWLIGVIFGIAASIDHDGPRAVARNALLIAAAQVACTLLIPF